MQEIRPPADVYESFIKALGELTDAKEGTRKWTEAQAHALKVMREFSEQLLLWGSPSVIEAWANSQRLAVNDAPGNEMLMAWFRVVLAIRKDLGHSDLALDSRDLLRVIIKDIDDFLPLGARL